jgi:integrase
LRRLQREQPLGPHVFTSERGSPMTPKSFHTLISRLGERAGMPFPIHPHMLRHACSFALANAGHSKRGSAIAISSTQSVIRSSRPIGLRIFGGTKNARAIGSPRRIATS